MSADWITRYAAKIATAADAIRQISPGRRILIGSGASEPARLVDALVTAGDHLADNDIVHLLTLGPAPYVAPEFAGRFRHTALFIGPNVRPAVHEGRADFMPVFLSEIPTLIRSRRVRIDVALVQVSPPDRHGYVSLGVAVDILRSAVDSAEMVIAEVNPRMPRTLGASFLHVDRIHRLVPVDAPLPELVGQPADDVSREIGRHVARLIPDGATLQTGIGKIPDAVLAELFDRKDLGVHTEMFSDGVMNLVEAGVVTGRRKTLLPGKIVTSFVMGTEQLYRWMDDNPFVEMRPSDFTNDPFQISRNDDMVAINSALAVDLTGQVAADTVMGRFFSGIGGQVDFIRGAARSKGGRPIIALPSTAKNGTLSRIQPALEEGAGIVTSRGDVHFVVTEWGIADLWGKNIRQRAMALIEIAHPDFRGELLAAAKERHYVFADQVAPRGVYPWAQARMADVDGDTAVMIRPVKLSDEERLRDFFYRLGDVATTQRFLGDGLHPGHQTMQRLVDLDYLGTMALVALTKDGGEPVAMARYDVDPATRLADVAFVVRDDWRSRGLASLLLVRLIEAAKKADLIGFTARIEPAARALLTVFQKSGLAVKAESAGDTCLVDARW